MISDSRSPAHADRTWVMAAFLLGAIAQGTPRDPGAVGYHHEALTHGETRVLHYLPTHLSAREIAAELYLSVNTVKTHQRHLYAKLGVRSRTEAVAQARALGLLARAGALRAMKSPSPDDAGSPFRVRR